MQPRMPLGDFLVAYLERAGVKHLFGLPGDLVLNLFHKFAGRRGLEIVTLSHEPGVGFAADGYARATGGLGVVVVTYGAGGHNVINPIAGAFAEESPLLVISGGPGEQEQLGQLIHHQAKEVESQHRIFQEVTCATCVVRTPERAALEIHELVGSILRERRPGYLEIHRDVVEAEIPVPPPVRRWDGAPPARAFHRAQVAEAARETAERIGSARRLVAIAGIEVHRERATAEMLRLAERLGAPVVSTALSKGAFPMDHPLHLGVYIGDLSAPAIRRRVESADLVLAFGALPTDIERSAAMRSAHPERHVWAVGGEVAISRHRYPGVPLRAFLRALLQTRVLRRRRDAVRYLDNLHPPGARARTPLAVNDLLWTVNAFLARHPGYDVFADSGDMLFGGLEIRVPAPGLYFAQGFYASMGFSVPGAMGAQIGRARRGLVLVGDGAFQMTGTELAHAPRHGCNPIVVVVNNGGWGIFRPVSPRADLLELPQWPYAELGESWGGLGVRVRSAAELETALERAHRDRRFALVEAIVDPDDLSPISRRYIRASSRVGRRAAPKTAARGAS
jgi:indolepyruvate decarboxylase